MKIWSQSEDGAQAVADEDDRPLPLQPLQRLGDHLLVVRVEGAGRLVEHDDRGLGEQGPGDADPLLLAAGQVGAVLGDDRVVAVRQLVDERRRAPASSAAWRISALVACGRP